MTTIQHRPTSADLDRVDWLTSIPFLAVHAACVLALFTEFAWSLLIVCAVSYFVRMFAITAVYHRYFSHRAFKTSRPVQFALAALATTSLQKGVLWWAGHHRGHHRHSDTDLDVHSPVRRGFFWSHLGWILARRYTDADHDGIRDFARYPELRWLDRYHVVPFVVMAVALFAIGGLPWLVWGGFIATVMTWHVTFTVNSVCHVIGRRRYETRDESRNNWLIALLTGGEGWHNNHHRYPGSARQGHRWWEVDTTYYVLRAMQAVGLIWDLRALHVRAADADRPAASRDAA